MERKTVNPKRDRRPQLLLVTVTVRQQVCSFLNLCSAESGPVARAEAEQAVTAAHRKLLAPLGDAAGRQGHVLPVAQPAVKAAHQRVADDPSSSCQVCEMAVTYIKVRDSLPQNP